MNFTQVKQYITGILKEWFPNKKTLDKFSGNNGTVMYDGNILNPLGYQSANGGNDTPVGTVITFMGNNPPKHYLACDGNVYNISDYPELAQFFKNQFESVNYFGGDGVTTFAIPDLRGEFLRGTGTGNHSQSQDSGTIVGGHQDATAIPHFVADKSDASTTETSRLYTTRPTNTSVLYCIRYETTDNIKFNIGGSEYTRIFKVHAGDTLTFDYKDKTRHEHCYMEIMLQTEKQVSVATLQVQSLSVNGYTDDFEWYDSLRFPLNSDLYDIMVSGFRDYYGVHNSFILAPDKTVIITLTSYLNGFDNITMSEGVQELSAGAKSFDLDVYSLDEQIVGKWIDGKPIYRRVWKDIIISSNQANPFSESIQIGELVSIRNIIHNNDCSIDSGNTDGVLPSVFYNIADAKFYVFCNKNNWLNSSVTVIVEYTKPD